MGVHHGAADGVQVAAGLVHVADCLEQRQQAETIGRQLANDLACLLFRGPFTVARHQPVAQVVDDREQRAQRFAGVDLELGCPAPPRAGGERNAEPRIIVEGPRLAESCGVLVVDRTVLEATCHEAADDKHLQRLDTGIGLGVLQETTQDQPFTAWYPEEAVTPFDGE